MNMLDIIFVVVLGYTAFRGLFRGLILEVASLGGVVLGVYLAITYHEELGEPLSRVISNQDWVVIASYLIIFIATILLVSFVAGLAIALVKKTVAAWLNYLGGFVFGILKGGLICAVIFWLFISVLPNSETVGSSRAAPYIQEYGAWLEQFVPESMRSMIPRSPGGARDIHPPDTPPGNDTPGYEPYGPTGPSDSNSTPI
ncbi:MAG: CvpA family protein [Oceanidesulfovibrio sp.]